MNRIGTGGSELFRALCNCLSCKQSHIFFDRRRRHILWHVFSFFPLYTTTYIVYNTLPHHASIVIHNEEMMKNIQKGPSRIQFCWGSSVSNYSFGRRVGKKMTSRMFLTSLKIMVRRSIETPTPPAGGMPYSSASRNASSEG